MYNIVKESYKAYNKANKWAYKAYNKANQRVLKNYKAYDFHIS